MNVLFLCLSKVWDINRKTIYTVLIREFIKRGDSVCIVSPVERRCHEQTQMINHKKVKILKVKTLNIKQANIIEKGLGTVLIEWEFCKAIKKNFRNIKFDLVLYTTPPVTFVKSIKYIKKRDNAKSYLLLKDIFPQNAVDMGMLHTSGLRGTLYKYFRHKEKQLYRQSDFIGCMSQANVDYVLKHNPEIDPDIVHVSPNSVEVQDKPAAKNRRDELRDKYNIPKDAKVFVYGGNLGKPQGIPFIIECLKANMNKADRYFVISGTGTEFPKLKSFVDEYKPENVLLINGLPKDEYEDLITSCDVGLIFLDYRFTIPNFPSRLLSYMQKSLPVLACTDVNTDIGKVIIDGDFGWWCASNDANKFTSVTDEICGQDISDKGARARKYLNDNFTVDRSYEIIMERVKCGS